MMDFDDLGRDLGGKIERGEALTDAERRLIARTLRQIELPSAARRRARDDLYRAYGQAAHPNLARYALARRVHADLTAYLWHGWLRDQHSAVLPDRLKDSTTCLLFEALRIAPAPSFSTLRLILDR